MEVIMRLDEVPPDPGLLRFWGSRDEVEAQARSRRRRPRPRCGAGSGELRARFPDCESQAHPLFRRGCVTASSGVRARSNGTPGSGVFSAQRRELPGQLFESPTPARFSGIPLGSRRAKPRVRVTPGTVSLESTMGGCRGLKNTRCSTRDRESDWSARSVP